MLSAELNRTREDAEVLWAKAEYFQKEAYRDTGLLPRHAKANRISCLKIASELRCEARAIWKRAK